MPQANSFECYPDFVIRTPLFSLDIINSIPGDKNLLPGFIRDQWKNPLVKDAILLASPSLYEQLDLELGRDCLNEKLTGSFIRYLVRMCYRCTPFGMFAGIHTGKISEKTSLLLDDPGHNTLNCRLDMEYLGSRIEKWTSDHEFRRQLSFRANTSLYKLGGKWRYIEVFFQGGLRKKYRIVSVEGNQVVNDIIAGSGELREWTSLLGQLTDMGYDRNEAEEFIDELIDNQVLIPEIFPNLTGTEFSLKLLRRTGDPGLSRSDIIDFRSLAEEISGIEKPGTFHRHFHAMALKASKDIKDFNPSRLIQSDMVSIFKNANISRDLSNKILLGIRILKSLSRPNPNMVLKTFTSHFQDRFGTREVPLPLVIDSEFGIGLEGPEGQQMADPGPLLDGLDFPVGSDPGGPSPPHPLLLRKTGELRASGDKYIDLDQNDLRELAVRKGEWPDQMYAMCRLTGQNENLKVIFDLASDGHPSHIMSRFGFLTKNGGLNKHISDMVRDDLTNHPDHILAEIVHLPEDRTGNILQRPSYYDWEIPYLASHGDQALTICTNEILVSVIHNKVILRHQPSGKKILPRLTNAHNYRSRQLPLYQLLAEVAHQESGSGYFPAWGWLTGDNVFLPGIRYDCLTLSSPRWRIKIDSKLKHSSKAEEENYRDIIDWVERNKLPQQVIWMSGDHEMPINWRNINIVLSAWETIRKKDYVIFRDNPYHDGTPVKSAKGDCANEIIISYKRSVK